MTLLRFSLPFQCLFFVSLSITVIESKCKKGCDLALASYYAWENTNVTFISEVLHSQLVPKGVADAILDFNKQVEGEDRLKAFTRVNVPFPCDCINGEFLGHVFEYEVKSGDTYEKIASLYYSNLTTVEWLQRSNTYEADEMAENDKMNVTVNCSCGDTSVSKNYGLFITYPLLPGETLEAVLTQTNLSQDVGVLVQSYNEGVNLSGGDGLIFVPGKDASGNYRPLRSSTVGLSGMVVAGISSAVVAGFLLLATGVLYFGFYQKKKLKWAMFPSTSPKILPAQAGDAPSSKANGHKDNIIDTSVEFSHEELAQATNSFSLTHKVGEGGFGAVYYAELRGEKVAIKKMGMQASKEFLAELKVLTRVHHLNLVRLIGYCVEGSLFLVYEYIENGNLSQHLHGSGKDPLPWSTRVQIALDSARGLEYVHEHTVPVYIHRDIKSANILIDKKFHGKVADFGLAKMFPKAGRAALLPTRLVGTFGYMAPEYARFGEVSPEVDVYAFGVVLYELISAKAAIVKTNDSAVGSKGLVALFENVLNQPDPMQDLCKLIDPRLGDNYPVDSVLKMAQLAKACTEENPKLRPSMRSIVIALTILSSSTQ
ncbi:Chitin elicitor receptor kinase 1, RLK1, putative [Theobroma cacao]|uniref:non-specific serine/threonine protein kinase n=1 Tax=Theobroma cacao TaxID=3641 RepID=A0A061DTI8_THECC|nr:Chitin elicitor receptor kinase 1, RLK1, putative [Theobroma cacao]